MDCEIWCECSEADVAMIVCVMLASISHYHSNNGCETPTHQISDQHKTKKPLKNWVAYGSGSWRIRTADPLLVRQMLWTSWAKLPICKAWGCKGSYYFLFSKLFLSFFFKGSCHLFRSSTSSHLSVIITEVWTLPPSCASLALERLNKDLNLGPHD